MRRRFLMVRDGLLPGCLLVGCLLVGCLGLATCAPPPLTVYTLDVPLAARAAAPGGTPVVVIAVARVTIPDELDTEDLVVRDGSTLSRSRQGRWSSRLSLGITARLTGRLAERYPQALVTDRPLTETPTDRVLVNIGRLEVTTAGAASMDADWLVVPRDTAAPSRRERAHITAQGATTGAAGTDAGVVALLGNMLDQLAAAIELPVPATKVRSGQVRRPRPVRP
jgi:uncharacterized lipoprotein YmbA